MPTEFDHPPSPQPYASPPFTVVLIITLLLFLFVGFFCIYFCRCFLQNLLYTWHLRSSPSGTPVGPGAGGPPGLDPSIIKSFPTFTYSSVKEYRRETYGLECAICLSEFKDEDILRLLTVCCHVFHQECIDLWLELHKSCPVCRRSLDAPAKTGENIIVDPVHETIHEDGPLEDSVSITIRDDVQDKRGENEERQRATVLGQSQRGHDPTVEKFSRSKTTGHSIVRSREEEEDKFTLRLPDHVTAKLIRGHNLTKSCTTFREIKDERTPFGEVSGTGDVNNV